MKKTMIVLMNFLLVISLYSITGDEIMNRAIETQKVENSALDIQMTLIDRNGETSIRRIQTLVSRLGDETRTITLFLSPARVKNTRFLTISNKNGQDDQWIFLPALNKVKRIAAGEQEGAFMGSDFSYSDMSAQTEDSRFIHNLIGQEVYEGLSCYVVESLNQKQEESAYGKKISWVDKDTWLTPKVEFYSREGNRLVKEMTCTDFTYEKDRWLARKVSMTTLADEHRTILEILQVKYDMELPSGYFTTSFLETGRIR